MAKDQAHISIDQAKCPPCPTLVCAGVCPEGILELGANKKPQVADDASCTGCGVCADLCPVKAITIKRAEATRH